MSSSSSYSILPWKTRIAVSFLGILTDTARRQNGSVNRRLLRVVDFRSSPTPQPFKGVKSLDVTIDPSRNLWFRLYIPTTAATETALPVIIFFHGGGFTFLSAASKAYDIVCRRFARRISAVVVSVDYRLAPEYRCPCQYDDGFDVLSFLDRNSHVLPDNADVSKCFLAGDSAGANICHHVAVRAVQAGSFERVKVVGLISIQPYFGGEERTESELRLKNSPIVSVDRSDWAWKIFLPDGSNRDHWASNVSGANAVDVSGLEYPDTMVVVGGHDPLQDWQRRYYEWLKKSGKEAYLVEYPNSIHAFYVFPELPESGLLLNEVRDFVLKCLSKL